MGTTVFCMNMLVSACHENDEVTSDDEDAKSKLMSGFLGLRIA